MEIKKLFVDLWASATSHILVAEWMPALPTWATTSLVLALTLLLLFLHGRKARSKRQKPTSPRSFEISRSSRGDFKFILGGTFPAESANHEAQSKDKEVKK